MKETKNLSITQIAKRTTIYKILKEELNYIPYNRLVKQEKTNESKEIKFWYWKFSRALVRILYRRTLRFGTNSSYFHQKFELNSTFRESDKISHPENKFNVLFVRTCLKYWWGTKLIFSGKNGTYFYKLIQQKKVNWKILKLGSPNLSRFDLYYFEKINDSDESSVKSFLQDCVKNLEEKKKNISYSLSYQKKNGGYILRIGSRQIFEFIKKQMG